MNYSEEIAALLADYNQGAKKYDEAAYKKIVAIHDRAEKESNTSPEADHVRARLCSAGIRFYGNDRQALVTHYLKQAMEGANAKA